MAMGSGWNCLLDGKYSKKRYRITFTLPRKSPSPCRSDVTIQSTVVHSQISVEERLNSATAHSQQLPRFIKPTLNRQRMYEKAN